VAAAPLPVFAWGLTLALERRRVVAAVAAGAALGWAQYCDAYYAIYGLLVGAALVSAQVFRIRIPPRESRPDARRCKRATQFIMVIVAAAVVAISWLGGGEIRLFGASVTMRLLYTPVLILTVLGLVWVWLHLRPVVEPADDPGPVWRTALVVLGVAALLVSPLLIGLAQRIADGRFTTVPIPWRSSPPGVDLLAFFIPNPNHAWMAPWTPDWLTKGRPDGFPEFTASLPLTALAVVLVAGALRAARYAGIWVAITAASALLALGPFIVVAGTNTYVPGPWALLRYVPGIGLARSPSRFAVMTTMGLCVLLAWALAGLRDRLGKRWRVPAAVLGVVMAVELLPIPRPLFSAQIPVVYRMVRESPNPRGAVLELPIGIRDGTFSIGNFSAMSQFCQTYHRKPLVGGYLSRISERRRRQFLSRPTLRALVSLSEGKSVSPELEQLALSTAPRFARRFHVSWVVIDTTRASPELKAFAVQAFHLVRVASDGFFELYRARPPASLFP
jgi:hypothetical protein